MKDWFDCPNCRQSCTGRYLSWIGCLRCHKVFALPAKYWR